ncbi:MAG: hypothetical protein ACKVU0_05860 [Saprospiraceae bacterium]
MKISLSILIVIIATSFCKSQNSVGVYCRDFHWNNEPFPKGIDFRRSFESIISGINTPPMLVERSRINEVFEIRKEDKNLFNDLHQNDVEILRVLKVNYVIFGNFKTSPMSDFIELQTECVKIIGEDALSKMVFPVLRFSEKELYSSLIFETKVKGMLDKYAFENQFGIVNANILENINDRLDKKDKEIVELKTKVDAIIEYSDIANLDIFGLPGIKSSGTISITSELSKRMHNIFFVEGKTVLLKDGDEIENYIDSTILSNPRFPFGYFAKAEFLRIRNKEGWKEYARKSIEILEKTTLIKGHHINHDEVLKNLKLILD